MQKNIVIILLSIVFNIIVMFLDVLKQTSTIEKVILTFLFSLIFLIFSFFISKKIDDLIEFIVYDIILFFSLILRMYCLDFQSGDYNNFLHEWVEFFKSNGGFKALKYSLGDYNVVYLYFLALFSYFPVKDLYLIKLLSVIFDVILAFYGFKIISLFTDNSFKKLLSFLLILFYPMTWLNSAYWAQCDSIYAAFCIMALYYFFIEKYNLSMFLFTLSFSFKLQTVFLLPIIAVFLVIKKLPLKKVFFIPLYYFATYIPALLFGKPLKEMITVYFNQVESYDGFINLNSPSAYSFLTGNYDFNVFKTAGIFTCGVIVLVLIYLAYLYKDKFNREVIFLYSALFVTLIPWVLPKMHDRYFYLADIFIILISLIFTKRFYLTILMFTASYSGYHAYLNGEYIIDMRYASLLVLFIVIVIAKDIKKRVF